MSSYHMRLQTRLLVVLSVLVAFVVMLTSAFITVSQRQRAMSDAHLLLKRDLGYLSRRLGHNLFYSNIRSIQITLTRALQSNPEMLFFEVTTEDGQVVLSSMARGELSLIRGRRKGETAYKTDAFEIVDNRLAGDLSFGGIIRGKKGEPYFDTRMHLGYAGTELGWLKVGYSTAALRERIRAVAVQVVAAGLLILMTVIASVIFIVRVSLSPLARLNQRLAALRDGRRRESVPELLGDMELPEIFEKTRTTEIRELALSFVALSEIVVESWQTQESQRYDLEKNVTDRTAALRRANHALLREITKKKEAEKRLQLKNSLLEALHESTLDLVRQVAFEDILGVLLKRAGSLMGLEGGFYFEYRKETKKLHAVVSLGPLWRKGAATIASGEGLVGRVWKSGVPLHVSDYTRWKFRMALDESLEGLGTCVAVPIRLSDGVGGVMGLAHFGQVALDEGALEVLSRFGELASIALRNAKLHKQVEEELQERRRVEEEKERLFQHLLQAQKLEAIGTLAGGVAHDINNLLMAIGGNITLIMSELPENQAVIRRGEKMETLVASGSKLTSQLLGFARGGRYHVRPEKINTMVKNSLSMFGRTRKGITLKEHLKEGLANVDMDRIQMEQVLLNLFLNASHAMPDGGQLTISTFQEEIKGEMAEAYHVAEGRYVGVRVADTGIGMDAATQSKIFDPFFTTREMGHGTGLGLASAYGIVKNHKGWITVTSEKGKGTCFVIYLPATSKPFAEKREAQGALKKGEGTVLVVDDEEAIRDVLGQMLQTLGYRCLFAENSSGALKVFREHQKEIDVVLLDMVMPDAGGDIAFKALKKIDSNVRVILSSGYSREGRAEKVMETGGHGFIQKPFDLKHLSQKIREILDHKA